MSEKRSTEQRESYLGWILSILLHLLLLSPLVWLYLTPPDQAAGPLQMELWTEGSIQELGAPAQSSSPHPSDENTQALEEEDNQPIPESNIKTDTQTIPSPNSKIQEDAQEAAQQLEIENAARIQRELAEQEQLKKLEEQRIAQQKADELALLKAQEAEKERLEQERKAKLEQERIAKAEQERKAQEERLEKERLERERKAKLEQERIAKAEQERKAQEERLEKERLERERKAKLEKERIAKAEKERLAKEKAEKERQAKIEKERLAKAEKERKAKEKAAADAKKAKETALKAKKKTENTRVGSDLSDIDNFLGISDGRQNRNQIGGGGGNNVYIRKVQQCIEPRLVYNGNRSMSLKYRIEFNEFFEINRVSIIESSNSPAFDQAAQQAIRACKPFPIPPNNEKVIQGTYTYSPR